MNKLELEEKLIDFSVLIIKLSVGLSITKAGTHLSGQIVRSGTSVSLNYGEAQSGESRRDFVHKMKVVLKELRETHINLKIILRASLHKDSSLVQSAIAESNELISIFVKSVVTAEKKTQ